MDIAYALGSAELTRLTSQFMSTHGVRMQFRLDKWNSVRWFFRMDGIEFIMPVFYNDEKGISREISKWDIRRSITQLDNVWLGKQHEVVTKILEEL